MCPISSKDRSDEYQTRLKKMQQFLIQQRLDACLLENPIDLFYFTGLELSYGRLWIAAEQVALFVDGRYIQVASSESPIQPVYLLKNDTESDFLRTYQCKKIGFDGSYISYARAEECKAFLTQIFPDAIYVSYQKITAPIRRIKSLYEIEKIRGSVSVLEKGFAYLQTKIASGVTEKELARFFEIFIREQGAEKASFDPIIAFGEHASMPHYRPSDAILKNNQMVLIDAGCYVDHYSSDVTRIYCNGAVSTQNNELIALTKEAHQAAIECCRPFVKLEVLDLAARKVFKKANKEQYFTHSLGHGIGLETHESPTVRYDGKDKDMILMPGMIITIEPGLYCPGVGGARWEDMILITESGCENLTRTI